jgi:hypothetical protein
MHRNPACRNAVKVNSLKSGATGALPMMDILMAALALALFAAAIGYTYVCDRL